MFQNHLMQLLALTAMEPPTLFEATRVQDEKVKVFRSLKPLAMNNNNENLILGQYSPGTINGQPVPGYCQEPGVDPASLTPTFAMMRMFIDNWRWRGVPFFLASGKRLPRKLTRIVVQFKEVPHSMFRDILGERILANRLTLGVYPDEQITIDYIECDTYDVRIEDEYGVECILADLDLCFDDEIWVIDNLMLDSCAYG